MKRVAHVAELVVAALLLPVARLARLLGWRPRRIVIVGWWGSETVGDVAILGQLLTECAEVAPGARVTLVSFDRAVSRASLVELGRDDVELIGVGASSGWAAVACRALVYGGGPLMESPSTVPWAIRARLARWGGARVMIYACGIGPVRSPRVARAVRSLLRSATQVVLRDRVSYDWDTGLSRERQALVSFDPAFDYVRSVRSSAPIRRPGHLALALRLPTTGYLDGLDQRRAGDEFLDTVARAINELARERALVLVGCTMHTGFAESDDHAVYEQLRVRLDAPASLQVPEGRQTVAEVVRAMETSQAAFTVRFHGMILALASDTPVVAVDYARPSGKASAAAELAGRQDAVVRWDALDAEDLARRLRRALDSPALPAPDFRRARQARAGLLADATA